MLQQVGSWNRYQFLVIFIMCLIGIMESSLIFIVPYLLHQQPYYCPEGIKDCNAYVCQLPPDQRDAFLPLKSPYFSLADQMGNYRCDTSGGLETVQSTTILAGTISMFLFSFFTQEIGRKKSLLISLVIGTVGYFVIYFSRSIPMLTVGVFIAFAGVQNAYQYTFCFVSEVVDEKHRIFSLNISIFIYGIGIMMNSFTFYGLRHWQPAFFWFSIVLILVILILTIVVIQKTHMDLLKLQESEQIVKALKRIGNINGINHLNFDQSEIKALQYEYRQESQHSFFSVVDVCRYKSLRNIAIPILIADLCSSYIYYAPAFLQKGTEDQFNQSIVSGISQMISCLVAQVVLVNLPRKLSMYILTVLSVIFAILLMLPMVNQTGLLYLTVSFLFRLWVSVFRLWVSVYLSITYLLTYESFPTQIRASAARFCLLSQGFVGAFEPWSISAVERKGISSNLLFAFAGILGFFINHFIKETFGCPPSEVIEELKQSKLLVKKISVETNALEQ